MDEKGNLKVDDHSSTKKEVEDENGVTSGDEEEKFDWSNYLVETKSVAASSEWFWQSAKPPENRFKVGHKLEAVDPRNNTITSVATVVSMFGPKIKLRLDGAGRSNDFWTVVDTSKIHPFGHTEKNNGHLQPPLSYEKDPVRYQTTIINPAKESKNIAPDDCFITEPPRPTFNQFKIGTKCEASDARNPTWICPVTVVDVNREKVQITFDGWKQQELYRYDSRDLYPCGWWQAAGIDLSKPPNSKKGRTSFRRVDQSSTSTSRPPSQTSGQNSSSEFRNIFDSVLGKVNSSSPAVQSVSTSDQQTPSPKSSSIVNDSLNLIKSTPSVSAERTQPVKPVQHAARKSMPIASTTIISPFVAVQNGKSSVVIEKKVIIPNEDVVIPKPDSIITTINNNNEPEEVKKITLHFNNCNSGPFLDTTKLELQFSILARDVPIFQALRDVFQSLINCARPGSAQLVFNQIPAENLNATAALSVTLNNEEGYTSVRHIPIYSSMVSAKRVLRKILNKLEACPNFISTETGCTSCSDRPVAKKQKLNDDRLSVDMTRKDKPSTSEKMGDSSFEMQETAPWWVGQDPSKWEVKDVVRFIGTVVDAQAADLFGRQEVDGRALVLLTPEILIKYMDVRVGPAVKISNAIERLKGTNRPNMTTNTANNVSGAAAGTGDVGKE